MRDTYLDTHVHKNLYNLIMIRIVKYLIGIRQETCNYSKDNFK